jgi:hypothetical protein
MRRLALALVAVALVVALVVFWFVRSSLDGMVARAIERHGSAITGTAVRVASVSVDLAGGRATVRGLRVANPEGFSPEPMLRLGEITVVFEPAPLGELREGLVRLREVEIRDATVRYELDRMGRANVDTIGDRAKRVSPGEAPPETEPTRFAIATLAMEGGRIVADGRALGREAREVALPALRLREVGGRDGAPPGVIARTLAVAITRHVAETVARERLRSFLEEKIDERLEGVGEAAKEVLREILGAPAP